MFAGCKNLQEINIPSSLIYIGDRAFENCTNLPKLIIPDDVEIAANAFD